MFIGKSCLRQIFFKSSNGFGSFFCCHIDAKKLSSIITYSFCQFGHSRIFVFIDFEMIGINSCFEIVSDSIDTSLSRSPVFC